MAQTDLFPRSPEDVRCSYHPDTLTRLRCSRCAKPICPRCAVRTQVGMRCPECAGVRGLPTYRASGGTLVRSAAVGGGVALLIGLVWGFIPSWNFYLALALGFCVAESIARVSAAKRGREMQAIAMASIGLGLVVSRIVIAGRLGIPLEEINALGPFVVEALYLRVIPDLLFAGLAMVIGWYRFR